MMKIRTVLIAAVLVATLSFATDARASTSTFFTVNPVFNGGVNVSFHTADFSSFWSLSFGPPSGQTLIANQEYDGAQRFAFHSPTKPGIDIFGDRRGCNTITGRFLVSDVAFAADGSVLTLAIDLEQHCEGAPPALFGSVRFNSSVAVEPRVSVADATALKGNEGTNDATVTFSLCLPSPGPVTVNFHTADGTAMHETDYNTSSGKVTFHPGATSATITIPIPDDRLATGNKAFQVRLKHSQLAPTTDSAP